MARGDSRGPDSVSEDQGEIRKDYAGHVLKVALASDTFAASAAFVSFSQFTEVVGTGYTAGGETSNSTWVRAGNVTDLGMANVGWAQNAAGPTDIRVAVIYDDDASLAGSEDVITVIDCTSDGTTPVSLVAGALNINLSTNAVLKATIT